MPGTLLKKKENKNKSWEKFLNSILYICEANYKTAQIPRGLPLNYSTFIITSSFLNSLAYVAWRFWLGELSNKGGRGQRNREESSFSRANFSWLRRSCARLDKTAMLRRLSIALLPYLFIEQGGV